jgi:hypothetical protein
MSQNSVSKTKKDKYAEGGGVKGSFNKQELLDEMIKTPWGIGRIYEISGSGSDEHVKIDIKGETHIMNMGEIDEEDIVYAKGGYTGWKHKMARGGAVKELNFDNSNLYFYGFGKDTNGNSVVKVGFPNQKAFSIQINNPSFRNTYSLKSNKVSEISESDLNKIEKEVVSYVKDFGSAKQKASLKTYSGFEMSKGGSTGKDKYTVSIDWELSKPRIKYGRKFFKDIYANSNKEAESIAVEQWNSVKANSNKKVLSINSINMTELNKKPIMAQGGYSGWKHKSK